MHHPYFDGFKDWFEEEIKALIELDAE